MLVAGDLGLFLAKSNRAGPGIGDDLGYSRTKAVVTPAFSKESRVSSTCGVAVEPAHCCIPLSSRSVI